MIYLLWQTPLLLEFINTPPKLTAHSRRPPSPKENSSEPSLEFQVRAVSFREVLLMEEILHQLRLVVYPTIYKDFIHPRWCRISSLNSILMTTLRKLTWQWKKQPWMKMYLSDKKWWFSTHFYWIFPHPILRTGASRVRCHWEVPCALAKNPFGGKVWFWRFFFRPFAQFHADVYDDNWWYAYVYEYVTYCMRSITQITHKRINTMYT